MERTQPEAAPGEGQVGLQEGFLHGKGCQALELPREGREALLRWLSVLCSWDSDFSNSNPNNSTIPSTSRSCCSPALTHLAILLMALLGVTFGTLSMLAATVASFKAVGEGAEVRVLI